MAASTNTQDGTPKSRGVSQDGLGKFFLMFVWPAAWFTFLIYFVGKQFMPPGGTTPAWIMQTIIVLGTG